MVRFFAVESEKDVRECILFCVAYVCVGYIAPHKKRPKVIGITHASRAFDSSRES